MRLDSRLVMRAVFYSGLVMAVASCSKKSSDDSQSAPASPELTVGSPVLSNGKAKITYKVADGDVRYECRVDVEGQKGDYEDCDPSGLELNTKAGANYKIYVKAISKSGTESRVIVRSFTAPGDQAPPSAQGQGQGAQQGVADITQLRTKILNADEIGTLDSASGAIVVRQTAVTMQLGLDSSAIPASDLRYDCKFSDDRKWKDCGGDTWQNDSLKHGSSYTLAARAVQKSTGKTAQEDAIKFRVELPSIQVAGQSTLEQSTSGNVSLSFQVSSATSYSCVLDFGAGTQPDCSSGYLTLSLSDPALTAGKHSLVILARSEEAVVAATTINFCAKTSCSTSADPLPPAGAPAQSWGSALVVGSGWGFRLTPDMHVTEYSTTKTTGVLNSYRVAEGEEAEMDPLYLEAGGQCGGLFDAKAPARRKHPGGQVYQYCHTRMPREVYKELNEYRLALNHIEVASNMAPVAMEEGGAVVSAPGYERISVSVFDADYEFMNSRSRFWNLCQNSWQKSVYSIPMLNQFFDWQLPSDVDFFTCEAILPNPISGQMEEWRVGAFFAIKGGIRMDFACGCGNTYPEAVEMVYMMRPSLGTMFDFQFAKRAQDRILGQLQRIVPN